MVAVSRLMALADRVVWPIVLLTGHSYGRFGFRANNLRMTKGWNKTLARRSETHRLVVNTSVVSRRFGWVRTNPIRNMLANEPKMIPTQSNMEKTRATVRSIWTNLLPWDVSLHSGVGPEQLGLETFIAVGRKMYKFGLRLSWNCLNLRLDFKVWPEWQSMISIHLAMAGNRAYLKWTCNGNSHHLFMFAVKRTFKMTS